MFGPSDGNKLTFNWGENGAIFEASARFRQGDVVANQLLTFSSDPVNAIMPMARSQTSTAGVLVGVKASVEYAMITSQTCDLAGPRGRGYPLVSIAPVYDITEFAGTQRGQITANKIGQFIRLDAESWIKDGRLWVADLRFEVAVEKAALFGRDPICAFASEAGYLQCSRKIARVRNRVAIDAAIETQILNPLRDKMRVGIDSAIVAEILIKATPSIVSARSVLIYVLLRDDQEPTALQPVFDDWHAEISANLPAALNLIKLIVRKSCEFSWTDYAGAEVVDFSDLSIGS